MNAEILGALARLRVSAMLSEAARRRALRTRRPAPATVRRRLARACRALGRAAFTLGDALADPR